MGAAAAVTDARSVIVRARGLTKRYGARVALQNVDLEIAKGEIYGLVGPDGAGKSTLLKVVAGVLSVDGGTVDVFGVSLLAGRAAESIKGRLGLMPQGLGLHLYPELTVEENIDFFARLRLVSQNDLDSRKRRLLEATRLMPFRSRPVKQLSGGMKQKLGLACTLVHHPELVILDEPTTGVDPVSRREFWTLLSDLLRSERTTILMSTAYMDEAARFERMSFMFDGRIVHDLAGAELLRSGSSLEDTFASVMEQHHLGAARRERPVTASRGAQTPRGVAIDADQLRRTFGSFVAVDRVTFQVGRGETFGLIGPNGAGKSTVIKMLTGLVPPTSGSARVAGIDIQRARHAVRTQIGYMSQVFSLYRDLSVLENIRLYAAIYGLDHHSARVRTEWVLNMAGLEGREDSWAGDLPIGLRQRLALGCALVHQPEILFLDEPTSGVDPIGRRRFWDVLRELTREDGVAVLVTTHYLSEVDHCDRVGLMYQGRLVANAPPDDLRREARREMGRDADVSMEDAFVHRIGMLERGGDSTGRVA